MKRTLLRTMLGVVGPSLLCAVALSAPAQAKTIHVRTNGSDTACNGTANAGSTSAPNCAYATPQKGVDSMVCGDTVLIHAGTYTQCNTNSQSRTAALSVISRTCSAGAVATVKGAGDGPVIFAPSTCSFGMYIYQSPYWTFGSTDQNEGITFGSNFTYGTDISQNLVGTVWVRNPDNNKVLGCTFNGNTGSSVTVGDTAEIAFWGGSNNASEIAYNNITCKNVEQCIAIGDYHGCGDDGPCSDSNATVHHNRIIEGVARRHLAIRSRGLGKASIHSNYIQLGTSSTPSGASSEGIQSRDNRAWNVYNNYIQIFSNSGYGIDYYNYNSYSLTQGHKTYNNTVFGATTIGIYLWHCAGCETRNNLVVGNSSGAINTAYRSPGAGGCGGGGSTGPWGYNGYFRVGSAYLGCGGETNETANDVSADPQFNAAGAFPVPYLQLKSTSPMIGRGYSGANAPTVDFDGDARSGARDLGADEASAAASTPPPQVQSLRRSDDKTP